MENFIFCAVQHSENAIVMKAMESDEIIEQHALEFSSASQFVQKI